MKMFQKEANYVKMEVLTLFLFIGCTLTVQASHLRKIKEEVAKFLENSDGDPIGANGHELKLTDKILGESQNSVVMKAFFDGEEVAIKISSNADRINRQIEAYRALYAFNDSKIENHGIPKVYHTGTIFKKYSAIVMTLFDESLRARFIIQNGSFNAYSTLQVFLQSVKALKYINSKDIVHNNIEPRNIFLRGNQVFIGGFDIAVKRGQYSEFLSFGYASSRYFRILMDNETEILIPFAIDDLESLVYTIWTIENIHIRSTPGGSVIARQGRDEKVALLTRKCEHFANFPLSKDACLFIFIGQMLVSDINPNYDQMISKLEAAIDEVAQKTNQTDFEWIKTPTTSSEQLKFSSV